MNKNNAEDAGLRSPGYLVITLILLHAGLADGEWMVWLLFSLTAGALIGAIAEDIIEHRKARSLAAPKSPK